MALNVKQERKYVLDVQAANKLSQKDLASTEEYEQILRAAKVANKILTKDNYYLILQETKKFYPYQDQRNYQVEYADRLCWREYVHEGVLGLHEAIIRFEVNKGFRLSTFAITWIRGSVSRLNQKKVKINISYEQAEKYSFTPNYSQASVSISTQQLELIRDFVRTLNPIDRDIVNRCFGLNNYRQNSLIAIGRCNNLSPKQVARRRDRIIKKLRNLLAGENETKQTQAILHCIHNDISWLAS